VDGWLDLTTGEVIYVRLVAGANAATGYFRVICWRMKRAVLKLKGKKVTLFTDLL